MTTSVSIPTVSKLSGWVTFAESALRSQKADWERTFDHAESLMRRRTRFLVSSVGNENMKGSGSLRL